LWLKSKRKGAAMIQIISGLRYNTKTAEKIAYWGDGLDQGDFRRCDEALYKTAKDAWFVAGEGGPLSRYSQPSNGGGMTGGEAIRPLTPGEARLWLEGKGFVDQLEEHFSGEIQDA
jgi:hypothetical protein